MKLQNIKKICQKCRAICCKMGSDFSEKEMKKVIKKNPKLKKYFSKIEEGYYELKPKNGKCPCLSKDYNCSIHKDRSLMCKAWPVFPEYKGKKKRYIIIQCPLTPHLSKTQLETMKKQASKLPKTITKRVETSLPKKDFDSFIKKFKKKK